MTKESLQKKCNEMTRKRFIKMLMSNGIQRNKAQEIASACQIHNIPYVNAFSVISAFFRNGLKHFIHEHFKTLKQSIKKYLQEQGGHNDT